MSKQFTVAIIGAGARGAKVYGRLMRKMPEQYSITHLCDIKQSALDFAGEEFQIPPANRFADPDAFFAERRADILVIATPDDCHVKHCLRGIELGYDILCEKPLTDREDECKALVEAQKKHGNHQRIR